MVKIGSKEGILGIILEKKFAKEYTDLPFEGKKDEILIINGPIILGGAGKTDEDLRSISYKIVEKAKKIGGNLTIKIKKEEIKNKDIKAIVEGLVLGNYDCERYKSKKESKKVNIFLDINKEYGEIVKKAEILANAQNFVREINEMPPNLLTPISFSEKAKEVAKALNLKIKVFDEKGLKKMGMNGILAVGKGSINEPRLIVMEYNGGGKKIAIVGKGVTFDSGGISLKPSKQMDLMKYDKSGAVITLGIIKAISELKIPINLIAIMPMVENLPSMKSAKPGDIIKMYNGKTVEILNTDAEGRLILADALAYASEKADYIFDLATLTGSIISALGRYAIGAFTNDENLIKYLKKGSDKSGERIWQMPLWEEYGEHMKGKIGDLANISNTPGEAGSITAAAFLKEFVEKPWVHLDIAGVDTIPNHRYLCYGATGIGTRLMIETLIEISKNKK